MMDKLKKIIFRVGIVLLMVFLWFSYCYFPDSIKTTITGTNSKNINGVDTYIVLTPYGIMTNYDNKLLWKFKSDNVQEKAKRLTGEEVTIKKYGVDIPFFSVRENILSITEL